MSTGRDLVKQTLKLIGALAVGETPSADDQSDALTTLNRMLSSWSTQGLMVNEVVRESFSLVAGQSSYDIGAAADFVTTRPVKILNASVVNNSLEYKLFFINENEWAQIPDKTFRGMPSQIYVEGTYPLETVNIYPVPDQVYSIILYSEKPLITVTASVDVGLPPGYEEAIVYSLAVRLAPEYQKTLPPEIIMLAENSKDVIRRANLKVPLIEGDPAMLPSTIGNIWQVGR